MRSGMDKSIPYTRKPFRAYMESAPTPSTQPCQPPSRGRWIFAAGKKTEGVFLAHGGGLLPPFLRALPLHIALRPPHHPLRGCFPSRGSLYGRSRTPASTRLFAVAHKPHRRGGPLRPPALSLPLRGRWFCRRQKDGGSFERHPTYPDLVGREQAPAVSLRPPASYRSATTSSPATRVLPLEGKPLRAVEDARLYAPICGGAQTTS